MTRSKKAPGDYAVGYGKPPVHRRFRKGVSGNPGGRAAKAPLERIKTLALREAYRAVTVKEGGDAVTLPAIRGSAPPARARRQGQRPGPARHHCHHRGHRGGADDCRRRTRGGGGQATKADGRCRCDTAHRFSAEYARIRPESEGMAGTAPKGRGASASEAAGDEGGKRRRGRDHCTGHHRWAVQRAARPVAHRGRHRGRSAPGSRCPVAGSPPGSSKRGGRRAPGSRWVKSAQANSLLCASIPCFARRIPWSSSEQGIHAKQLTSWGERAEPGPCNSRSRPNFRIFAVKFAVVRECARSAPSDRLGQKRRNQAIAPSPRWRGDTCLRLPLSPIPRLCRKKRLWRVSIGRKWVYSAGRRIGRRPIPAKEEQSDVK